MSKKFAWWPKNINDLNKKWPENIIDYLNKIKLKDVARFAKAAKQDYIVLEVKEVGRIDHKTGKLTLNK